MKRYSSLNRLEEIDELDERNAREQRATIDRMRQQANVAAHRDANKLTARVLREIGVCKSKRIVLVGVRERSTWPQGNFDHVPIAVDQLRELGLTVKALPICQPLDPVLLLHSTPSWRQTFRQCIVLWIN